MEDPLVELKDVVREYPGGVRAVAGISLTVGRGEAVAVVGRSGSGKSSLLNLVGTLDRPTSGTVRIDGHDVGTLRDRALSALRARTIGFVFQQFHLTPGVVVADAVADGLLYSGVSSRERHKRAAAALERVGLGHRTHHRPHELSGGEQQRVAIARAVVGDPPLLLADEPTGNLDSASGAAVMELLTGLNGAGTTVVLITHDRDVAAALPRRVEIADGIVVSDGAVADD
ncbi:peptide ABC transporter ATP-binding protein [Virgisporangium aliadipatigenens]|uniref:Peptide ABC transporter ATP-binding protein n=1 Tax=Virgisporangium aliadipatigenens TaxID=741659 RepID=A0A8J4DN10_9ACTN|nr:ABC transporter ATP-binding protein [Virgisporangium aliadipatigenens]GIJ44365.1 peptide ABC transporter ATP-binding protein [Virgisporangium aliadipatigenens]